MKKEHAVVIAGGGPTGLMLAAELALAGVDAAIVERRPNQELAGSRAGGLHARTIEIFDQRGIAERFLSAGTIAQVNGFALVPLDISDFPTRHNYGLALYQNHIERILAEWAGELGVPIHRSREVTGFVEDESGIDIELTDGSSIRARYLAGCDGGRSVVRKLAGIQFPGWDATTSWMIAEVETSDEPKWGLHTDAQGVHAIAKSDSGGARIVLTEPSPDMSGEPTLEELRAALLRVYETDFGIRRATWISRFNDMTRQAARYRKGRVMLAGDAANVRAPVGGQGLGLGIHDAVNLGWKLAQVVKGVSPDSLLDTYHDERHPVVARVLRNVMAQVALRRTDEHTKALLEVVGTVVRMDEPRKHVAGLLSGLDVHYDLGAGHPLLGRRMPDLEITSANGSMRVFSLLHEARHVLLNFGPRGAIDVARWSPRVESIDASYDGRWELPVIGSVNAPSAVLIRPDGHVAWVGEGTLEGLAPALQGWVGFPS